MFDAEALKAYNAFEGDIVTENMKIPVVRESGQPVQTESKGASLKAEDDSVPGLYEADPSLDPLSRAALIGVSRALASMGRAFICLDPHFCVLHASLVLEKLLGPGTAVKVRGRPVEELLGEDLFGPNGPLRRALLAGDRREGWRATLQFEGLGPRLVSITVAPLKHGSPGICDPRIAHLVMMRPAEEEPSGGGGPTFFSGAVAASPAMLQIFRLIENLEHSEATVLITGETGTGKEVIARAIHEHSPRRHGGFVAVNCGALPAELLDSELFGHVRGAFTGAVRDRLGRFEVASEGTLFLDEIADVAPQLQVKLLRVLQEHTFERVGENQSRTTNARIIAATNQDLRQAMAAGKFREDLYYRLRVVPIEIPPLRDRREDIRPLASHLLARFSQQQGLFKRLSPQAMRVFLDYSWPGNVRELANAIEYAVAVSKTVAILPEDLPGAILGSGKVEMRSVEAAHPVNEPVSAAGKPATDKSDASQLRAALETHQWRRDATARALGISRTTLWRLMREHKLI